MSREACAGEMRVGHNGASIRWCSECGDFHLALGYVQISLTSSQFSELHSLINDAMRQVTKQQTRKSEEEGIRVKPQIH
jgi:hypothetical protein